MTYPNPSTVAITYTAPGGSPADITSYVLFRDCYFESQLAAVPGAFSITVRDMAQTQSFVTGGTITLSVDGVLLYGGYIRTVTRQFAVPVDKTTTPSAVVSRQWLLTGVDYNILLDKRVAHKTPLSDTSQIGITPNDYDGNLIRNNLATYFDLPSGFDATTKVANVNSFTAATLGASTMFWQQGETLRSFLDQFVVSSTRTDNGAAFYATVYYIDAAMRLNYLAIQNQSAPFGFSDKPDGSTFIGFRDGSQSEDGSSIANDVFVWGGSPFTANGTVVVGHATNTTSVTAHNRWQLADVHPGDDLYKSQNQVNARANALISGLTTGTSPVTGAQGLVNPDELYTLTWFGHDVPLSGGSPQHLTPGMVVPLNFWTFSTDGGSTPYSISVPLRQIKVSFPNLSPITSPSKAWVQFEGTFGILLSDPVWLWSYLLKRGIQGNQQAPLVATTSSTSTTFPYGSIYQGIPTPNPPAGGTLFTIPTAYIPGATEFYKNGLILTLNTDYTESSPTAGQYTLTVAPTGTDKLYVVARTA